MNKLFIISNESIYKNDNNKYLCDNLDMKSTPEGLARNFEVNIIARKSKHVRCHTINTDKINLSSSIFSFLKNIMKSLKNKESKYLIVSISPYTFLACIFLRLFKKKLLKKQKKGKARSKQFGRVEIPQEAFIGVLKISKEN